MPAGYGENILIKINGIPLKVENFPDGTPRIKLFPALKFGDNPIFVTWLFDSMSELFTLQCIADYYKGKELILDMPYIPNARMDRVKNPEEVFTLKSFAKIINAMGFSNVSVKNAHSDVSAALIDNIRDTGLNSIENFLNSSFVKVDTIMFPDTGACKRYSELSIVKDNFDIVVGEKTRDWKTGQILSLEINGDPKNIEGKDILIIDDICSKGGTFKFSALKLKEMGANKIYLYVTHCENVIDIAALKEAGIEKVFTTKSIYREEKVTSNGFIEITDLEDH